ncbi:MAG: hypothetical protein KDI13_08140 [Alphaproteobacteria bacterium]|nr:hypothetical protein [Alphaproteobacteria bacterium]
MDLPAGIAADAALARQNVAFSAIKSSADQSKAIAKILEKSIESVPKSASHGQNLNIVA